MCGLNHPAFVLTS
jgi:hypothetical protein